MLMHLSAYLMRMTKMSYSEDELRDKRRDLELSLANQYQMSDRSKYELIRKIMDVLEDAMEDDKRLEDD